MLLFFVNFIKTYLSRLPAPICLNNTYNLGGIPLLSTLVYYAPLEQQTNNDYYGLVGLIIILILCLFLVMVLYNRNYTLAYHNILFFFVSIFIIILLSMISIYKPLFAFLLASLVTIILTFVSLPISSLKVSQGRILTATLDIFYKYHILSFLSVLYVKFFCVSTRLFWQRFTIIFMVSLFYVLGTRWYFMDISVNNLALTSFTNIFIYICILLGIGVSYLRFILYLSIFFVPLIVTHHKHMVPADVLFILGGENDPNPPNIPETPPRRFSLFSVGDTINNNYNTYTHPRNTIFFRYGGFCIGFCTLLVTGAAVVYAKQQTEASRAQVHAQEVNNAEMQTQNDLEAYAQQLITKEQLCQYQPRYCQTSTAQMMAERMQASKKAGMPGIKSTLKDD